MQINLKLLVSLNSASPSSVQSRSRWSAVSRRRTQRRHRLALFGLKRDLWCWNGPCAMINHIGSFLRNSLTSIVVGTVYSPSASSNCFSSQLSRIADFSSRSLPRHSSVLNWSTPARMPDSIQGWSQCAPLAVHPLNLRTANDLLVFTRVLGRLFHLISTSWNSKTLALLNQIKIIWRLWLRESSLNGDLVTFS